MGLFSGLTGPPTKSLDELTVMCETALQRGDFQKAARIAHKFGKWANVNVEFEEEEKAKRIAVAYYLVLRAIDGQIRAVNSEGRKELFKPFFVAWGYSSRAFQTYLLPDTSKDWNTGHPDYKLKADLDMLYDGVYEDYPEEELEGPDTEAQQELSALFGRNLI